MSDVEELVRKNTPLVYFVIHRDFPMYIRDDDVVQEGMIGLWYAAKAYDPSRAEFSSLAIPSIHNNISRYFRVCCKPRPPGIPIEECMAHGEFEPWSKFEWVDFSGWMDSLDETSQQMVVLRLKGLTQGEIAGILGCSRQNVNYTLKKIRRSFGWYI